ncbi:MAG: DUF302 domain-containing protein [Novosphingobium sp.]
MSVRHLALIVTAALSLGAVPASARAQSATAAAVPADVMRLESANGFDDTIVRLKSDVQAKGIRLFDQIDQAALGAQAGLPVQRSTLVIFGNPPLGVQFLQSSPYAGLDWPVRMLVFEDANHKVWVSWTRFDAIARRYGMTDRAAQIKMASEVALSIATAATSK